MRVNRRFLYWGVFLLALGGVLVAADLGGLESGSIAEALRLWPLAIIAIGSGIVLRRTRFSLSGGMLAAAVPGLVLGGGFALATRIDLGCGADGVPSTVATREGLFDGPARVSVAAGCGSLIVTTAPGPRRCRQRTARRRPAPIIDASARSLSIDGAGNGSWQHEGLAGDEWRLTLPTTAIESLSVVVDAGRGQVGLPGAQIGHLEVTTNAGQTTVDLSAASVASLSGEVNAGMLSFSLPATGDIVGSLEVNAGALEVCVPGELGLRVRHSGALNGISINGRRQTGADWQSPNYLSATYRADLSVEVNLGNVMINPTGGCK